MSAALQSIPVFYTPRMVAPSLSFSPSSMKPSHVVAAWQATGIPITLHDVPPITEQDICLAHDPAYVRGVLSGKVHNGFENCSLEIAESLFYTNASMRDAAVCALDNDRVAVSPTSGFHHASFRHAASYCTFNGLVIAALWLLHHNKAKHVGILDCDYHYGDGTEHILGQLDPQCRVKHFSAGAHYTTPHEAEAFLAYLPTAIQSMRDCDIILYQAGADPHLDDPLGGFLNTAQLYQRDLIVFQECHQRNIPVAWNLAGGYQQTDDGEPDWNALCAIHNNTLTACWEVMRE